MEDISMFHDLFHTLSVGTVVAMSALGFAFYRWRRNHMVHFEAKWDARWSDLSAKMDKCKDDLNRRVDAVGREVAELRGRLKGTGGSS